MLGTYRSLLTIWNKYTIYVPVPLSDIPHQFLKMALRMQNSPHTISTSGDGPEDHVVHWERYFGPMDDQTRATYANDAFSYRTHNLPKAYEGKNLFLQVSSEARRRVVPTPCCR